MKVIFDKLFHTVYASDPAAVAGRMHAAVSCLPRDVVMIVPDPAAPEEIELAQKTPLVSEPVAERALSYYSELEG